MTFVSRITRGALRGLLMVWHRGIAPLLPPMCRFQPSCAAYAIEALEKHTLRRALVLIVRRVGCCNLLHPGGFDPVPEPSPRAPDPEDKREVDAV